MFGAITAGDGRRSRRRKRNFQSASMTSRITARNCFKVLCYIILYAAVVCYFSVWVISLVHGKYFTLFQQKVKYRYIYSLIAAFIHIFIIVICSVCLVHYIKATLATNLNFKLREMRQKRKQKEHEFSALQNMTYAQYGQQQNGYTHTNINTNTNTNTRTNTRSDDNTNTNTTSTNIQQPSRSHHHDRRSEHTADDLDLNSIYNQQRTSHEKRVSDSLFAVKSVRQLLRQCCAECAYSLRIFGTDFLLSLFYIEWNFFNMVGMCASAYYLCTGLLFMLNKGHSGDTDGDHDHDDNNTTHTENIPDKVIYSVTNILASFSIILPGICINLCQKWKFVYEENAERSSSRVFDGQQFEKEWMQKLRENARLMQLKQQTQQQKQLQKQQRKNENEKKNENTNERKRSSRSRRKGTKNRVPSDSDEEVPQQPQKQRIVPGDKNKNQSATETETKSMAKAKPKKTWSMRRDSDHHRSQRSESLASVSVASSAASASALAAHNNARPGGGRVLSEYLLKADAETTATADTYVYLRYVLNDGVIRFWIFLFFLLQLIVFIGQPLYNRDDYRDFLNDLYSCRAQETSTSTSTTTTTTAQPLSLSLSLSSEFVSVSESDAHVVYVCQQSHSAAFFVVQELILKLFVPMTLINTLILCISFEKKFYISKLQGLKYVISPSSLMLLFFVEFIELILWTNYETPILYTWSVLFVLTACCQCFVFVSLLDLQEKSDMSYNRLYAFRKTEPVLYYIQGIILMVIYLIFIICLLMDQSQSYVVLRCVGILIFNLVQLVMLVPLRTIATTPIYNKHFQNPKKQKYLRLFRWMCYLDIFNILHSLIFVAFEYSSILFETKQIYFMYTFVFAFSSTHFSIWVLSQFLVWVFPPPHDSPYIYEPEAKLCDAGRDSGHNHCDDDVSQDTQYRIVTKLYDDSHHAYARQHMTPRLPRNHGASAEDHHHRDSRQHSRYASREAEEEQEQYKRRHFNKETLDAEESSARWRHYNEKRFRRGRNTNTNTTENDDDHTALADNASLSMNVDEDSYCTTTTDIAYDLRPHSLSRRMIGGHKSLLLPAPANAPDVVVEGEGMPVSTVGDEVGDTVGDADADAHRAGKQQTTKTTTKKMKVLNFKERHRRRQMSYTGDISRYKTDAKLIPAKYHSKHVDGDVEIDGRARARSRRVRSQRENQQPRSSGRNNNHEEDMMEDSGGVSGNEDSSMTSHPMYDDMAHMYGITDKLNTTPSIIRAWQYSKKNQKQVFREL